MIRDTARSKILRRTLPIVATLALLSPARAADADLVRATFATYKAAVLAGNGEAAAEALTSGTFDYYAESRDRALYGTEEELKALSIVDLMQAMTLRHRLPASELRVLSGRQLVVMAVNEGWVGKESADRVDIGEVTVSGETATGIIVNQGHPTTSTFSFAREGGSWKLDLVKLAEVTGAALDTLAEGQGFPVERFVMLLLEKASGKPVPEDIWTPPLQRPTENGAAPGPS